MPDTTGEPVWEVEETVPLVTGSAEPLTTPSTADRPPVVLWLPDPEQPRGWREHMVRRTAPEPERRPLGFQPRR
jgi:hypothetical protein